MNVLYQSAFLKALGWSLLDSFWQMGVLWLIYIILSKSGHNLRSGQKHSLALLSLAGGALWFLITLVFHFSRLVDEGSLATNSEAATSTITFTLLYFFIEPALPFLSLAYLLSVCYLLIRLYRQYHATQRLFTTNIYKAQPELRIFVKNIAASMGINKHVSIWLSDLVDTPLTIGFWKPVILLPVAAINHLSLQQAEAIVLHELNHIRRNDYFINLLIACIDIILFFNPFVRVLINIIKSERENCCDDMVLQFRYDAGQYASALLLLEKNRSPVTTLTINATGKSRKLLLNRVERILNKKSSGSNVSQKFVAYILCAFLIGLIAVYNPGKVIVKTIDPVQHTGVQNINEQVTFATPTVVRDETRDSKQPESRPALKQVRAITEINELKNGLGEFIVDVTESEDTRDFSSTLSYAGSDAETRDYSIAESPTPIAERSYYADVHPYVPSTSFTFHPVEDTALPKKYVLTHAELKAKESMTAALKALQQLDWQKLENEIIAAGKKIDVLKLQQELQKAISDVDWKKINEEIQSSLIETENELLREHSNLRSELKKHQQDHKARQIEQKKIYDIIVQDRMYPEKAKEVKPEKKKVVQAKKIVCI